jgi:hypothetical protein
MLRLFSKPVGGFKFSHGPTLRAVGAAVLSGLLAFAAIGCLAGGGPEAESAEDSIVGPDEDGNGIRDDVDNYIDRKYDGEREQAVRQFAVAVTEELVRAERGNEEAARGSCARKFRGATRDCMHERIGDAEAAHEAALETRAQILNTYRRSELAEKASGIAGGHVFDRAEGGVEEVCKQPEDLF